MFSRIHKRLTYANVVMTLALVFAMSGGAYAAKRYLINSAKQINPKVQKALKGANGKDGTVGPVGPAGSVGPVGPVGPKGETGAAGKEGPSGKEGVSGKEGKEGSPWTAGGTLPAGASEHGEWTITQRVSGEGPEAIATNLSFPIPLAAPLDSGHVHYIGPGEGEGETSAKLPEGCKGNYKKPEAEKGNLCVFAKAVFDHATFEPLAIPFGISNAETGAGAGMSGAYLLAETNKKLELIAIGDWVVTG